MKNKKLWITGVFSLTGWSRQIRAGFLVSRVTQDTAMPHFASGITKLTDGQQIKPITLERYNQKIAEAAKLAESQDKFSDYGL